MLATLSRCPTRYWGKASIHLVTLARTGAWVRCSTSTSSLCRCCTSSMSFMSRARSSPKRPAETRSTTSSGSAQCGHLDEANEQAVIRWAPLWGTRNPLPSGGSGKADAG